MKICSDNIFSEENEEDDSCTVKYLYHKDEVRAMQKESDFGWTRFSTNSLVIKASLCLEDGRNKHIYAMDDTTDAGSRGEASSSSAMVHW